MKAVFIDRDGTIIVEPPDEQIDSLDKLELIPHAIEGLRLLCDRGFQLVMVTNQDGLGTDRYPLAAFEAPQNKLLRILAGEGIAFSQVFVCPHVPADQCNCRKPKTGLLDPYLKEHSLDLSRSFVFGDRETDVQLGKNLGCKTIRLSSDVQSNADFVTTDFLEACHYMVRSERTAHVERTTAETSISIGVALDGTGKHTIDTGVGFFDHMLAQLSKHSLLDLTVSTKGDLRVDEHHTVEDTGLAIGTAIRQALGDKRGIERYGFLLPMDESSAQVALDLSDRPYFVFNGTFEREKVGEFPTELVEDFFRALADGLRANLHITVQGRNDHHKIEAIFKSVARTLKQAVALDQRSPSTLPSTKGIL
ncbi:MAG: bifunctional histidinol-phosphatase/imidazoleglycerol-phosphate dehydratase HisB [Ignavibacteriales bacterium]|nr:bifunctional histidinol-phosphatase/imidazoleglycerol-phosphate dehydratase HisB [Ignavibacteriales bacterium]